MSFPFSETWTANEFFTTKDKARMNDRVDRHTLRDNILVRMFILTRVFPERLHPRVGY